MMASSDENCKNCEKWKREFTEEIEKIKKQISKLTEIIEGKFKDENTVQYSPLLLDSWTSVDFQNKIFSTSD